MKIGIDLSVLQTPHRERGIGATVINFINNLSVEDRTKNEYLFYIENTNDNASELLKLLDLNNVSYTLENIKENKKINLQVPGPRIISRLMNAVLRNLYAGIITRAGDNRFKNLGEIDYFIQFSQNQPLPPKRKVKSIIIAYDIIPYVLETEYLWDFSTSRARGCSIKGSFRNSYRRFQYKNNTKVILKKAYKIIAISAHTKNDLIKYIGMDPSKITVCLLGINDPFITKDHHTPAFKQYSHTSWGYIPREFTLKGSSYLLFIGGVDPRRKLVELVAAFNILRARGFNIKLVLSGDTMLGASNVPNAELQEYLRNTSYIKDIYFLGFVSVEQREWLYKHALAFVYPSIYEGFGLPIIEAMQYGTPVITFNNSSIPEVGGDAAIYVDNYMSIATHVEKLIEDDGLRKLYSNLGKKQSAKFSWARTSKNIMDILNR